MEVFVSFSAETSSRKFVRWVDGLYRYLMSCLFSGEFITSAVGTFDVDLMFESFCLNVYRDIKSCNPSLAAQFWQDLAEEEITWVIYGDDFIYTIFEDYEKWFNLGTFNSFLKKYWDTELKMDACHSCSSFFTRVVDNKIDRRGVIFLKFLFVNLEYDGKEVCMVWKPAESFIVKAGLSPEVVLTPMDQLVRIHGLMLSSAGTNSETWEFLKAFADVITGGAVDAYSTTEISTQNYFNSLKLMGFPQESFSDPYSIPDRELMIRSMIPGSEYRERTAGRNYRVIPAMM